jgi:hypothetical protein
MVDASLSRSGDSLETSNEIESSRKKKKRQQVDSVRPVSVHETISNNDFDENSFAKEIETVGKLSPVNHKEVYSMEDILKEENGIESLEAESEEFHEDEDEGHDDDGCDDEGHDDVRFSPEKEQALQTLDEVIQAAEDSMSKKNNIFGFYT